jgi:segregation and condensation protein B
MDDAEGVRIIEALLFVSEEPLTGQRIAEILECERREALRLARKLREQYETNGRAVSVEEVAGGFQLRTRQDLVPWIRKYLASRPARLSRPALEVLAVVAYRQPVTRQEIEAIRGVDCSGVLQSLLERAMIKIMGRKDVPGRPIIYGTTRRFLEQFSLSDLSQLPTLREFAEPPGGHARPEGEAAEGTAEGEAAGEAAAASEGTAAEGAGEPPDAAGATADGAERDPDVTAGDELLGEAAGAEAPEAAEEGGTEEAAGEEKNEEDYDVAEEEIGEEEDK